MRSSCSFCQETSDSRAMYCGRCGARIATSNENQQFVQLLQLAQRVIHTGAPAYLRDALKRIRTMLEEKPDIYRLHDGMLVNLARALKRWPGILERPGCVKQVIALLHAFSPMPEFSQLLSRMERLREFERGMTSLSAQWNGRKLQLAKVPRAINALADEADLSESEKLQLRQIIAARWPVLAPAIDKARFGEGTAWSLQCKARHSLWQQDFEIALKHAEEAVKEAPDCIEAHETLARALLQLDEESKAIWHMRKAVELGSANATTLNNLAWHICRQPGARDKDLREAYAAANQAVQMAPVASHWDTLAEVQESMLDLRGAVRATRKSLELRPDKEIYRQRMARLCDALEKEITLSSLSRTAQFFEDESGSGEPELTMGLECPADEEFLAEEAYSLEDSAAWEPPPPSMSAPRPPEQPRNPATEEPPPPPTIEPPLADEFAYEDEAPAGTPSRSLSSRDSVWRRIGAKIKALCPFCSSKSAEDESPEFSPKDGFPSQGELDKEPVADPVDCTVFAPPAATAGSALFVQVFVHCPPQAEMAALLAESFDEEARRRAFKSLSTDVERGTVLTFDLLMPGLDIDDSRQELTWQGRPESVQFGITVPSEHKTGAVIGTVRVCIGTVPVGCVKFKLNVGANEIDAEAEDAVPTGEQAIRFRKAFASYASADRHAVLPRVQMLRTVGIDCFQDALDLDPGSRWEQELYRHIDECDLFLLFWSSSARESDWVKKEVLYALERKSNDELAPPEICPVIIEGPPPVPPPADLAHLHFDDRTLYFMKRPQPGLQQPGDSESGR